MNAGSTLPENTAAIPADLVDLHKRFPLAGLPANRLLSADPALLEYLLSVLRGEPHPPPGRNPEEWRTFLAELDSHLIRPVLTWRLLRGPVTCRPPADALDRMKRELLLSSAIGVREDHFLRELLGRLEARGVPPLLLKGAALARSVYPDVALRPSSDIDILVREADLEAASDVFAGLGYTVAYDKHGIAPGAYSHLEFEAPPGPSRTRKVEVHWRIADGFTAGPGRIDGLFERSVEIPYPPFTFRTLDPVDHLVYASYHALYQHGHSVRLNWIYDIALLASTLGLERDGERVVRRAAEYDAVQVTRTGLRLAAAWTSMEQAVAWREGLAWSDPSAAERRAWQNRPEAEPSSIVYATRKVRMISSNRERASYLFACVFPPDDSIRHDCSNLPIPLSRRTRATYYVRRWFRIVGGLVGGR